ncbi:MAG: TonB-dependent siderophore receptor [Methylococcaceae bacterium]|nr:TonB-dependent siderophore receptor [Methylococcaceae bacterium]
MMPIPFTLQPAVKNLKPIAIGLMLLSGTLVQAKDNLSNQPKTSTSNSAGSGEDILDINDSGEVVIQKFKVTRSALHEDEAESKAAPEDTGYKRYNKTRIIGATRTDTPLKEIPQSVVVVTRKVINDQQSVMVTESLRNVSGIVTTNPLFTASADKTRIRGFAAEQLLDGFTQYYNPGDRESTNNLERIEVLKGANAVLYSGGSGAPVGGVVNLVSKLPTAKAFGQLGMKVGSYDFYQPFVDINQPLTNNILFRITGEFTDSKSFVDVVHNERYNINPVLTFTNHESTTLTLQGRLSRWRQQDYQGLPATGTVVTDKFTLRRDMFIGPASLPPSISEFDGMWATLDHKLNNVWSLNFKARYAESLFDQKARLLSGSDSFQADEPVRGAKLPLASFQTANAELYQEQEEKSFLGNALAQFDLGPTKNKLLIGADYSRYADAGFLGGEFAGNVGVNLLTSTFPAPWAAPEYIAKFGNVSFVNNTTYGGYAQLQSNIYERLHLLFSVRAGVVDIDYHTTQPEKISAQTTTLKMLPRAGAVFDITKDFSLFVNYSQGMRGQPFVNFARNTKPAPELSETIEGGIKFNFSDKFTGQLAAYQIDRTNVAVSDYSDGNFRSITAGKQRSYGFDADLTWMPFEGLNILANYAYTNAFYVDSIDSRYFQSAQAYIPNGATLPSIPTHSTRFWANYDFQQPMLKGLSIGAGVYWQSAVFLSNNNKFQVDGFYNVDASIAYKYERYKVALSVKNLTDEEYYQSYGYLNGRVAPGPPISAYATFSVDY